MKKILVILPESIGGRLTLSSMIDGFLKNGFEVIVYDEIYDSNFKSFLNNKYDYIIGYDFSPVKLKIDYDLKIKTIAYFSDVIESKTAGREYIKYNKYLKNNDICVFYWDRTLSKEQDWNYMPHFVNCEIYKNYLKPVSDVLFMGRLDTDLRLRTYLELNKALKDVSFSYYGIEKHYLSALERTKDRWEKEILKRTYKGFIDNERKMAEVINKSKIVYNINSQGKSSLNYRTFQVLSCKRLIISDFREELDLFDNIIPIWNDFDDLAEKIRFFLTNKVSYDKITKKAQKIIRKNHDCKKCVKDILRKTL